MEYGKWPGRESVYARRDGREAPEVYEGPLYV